MEAIDSVEGLEAALETAKGAKEAVVVQVSGASPPPQTARRRAGRPRARSTHDALARTRSAR